MRVPAPVFQNLAGTTFLSVHSLYNVYHQTNYKTCTPRPPIVPRIGSLYPLDRSHLFTKRLYLPMELSLLSKAKL